MIITVIVEYLKKGLFHPKYREVERGSISWAEFHANKNVGIRSILSTFIYHCSKLMTDDNDIGFFLLEKHHPRLLGLLFRNPRIFHALFLFFSSWLTHVKSPKLIADSPRSFKEKNSFVLFSKKQNKNKTKNQKPKTAHVLDNYTVKKRNRKIEWPAVDRGCRTVVVQTKSRTHSTKR